MKKITVFTFFVFGNLFFGFSQAISENALGLRLGDSDGFGAEISYQKFVANNNRLQFDLGWRDSRKYDAFKLAGVYQWVDNIDGGFNWYYGFGGGLGSVDFEPVEDVNGNLSENDDGLFVFVAGNVGVEYNFDIPLVISIGTRPELGLINFDGFDNNFLFDLALGIRYQF